MYLIT